MRYEQVVPARFLARPNRFVAQVELEGRIETVHVKNTGRCRELLVPGCRVYLAHGQNPARKTAWDLIAAEKERPGKPPLLINLDSQAPNSAAEKWLRSGGLFGPGAEIRREVRLKDSRFDFQIRQAGLETFLEVKGCTLEQDGVALFPDAPTTRGQKHLHGLTAWAEQGQQAVVLVVIQMEEVRLFRPNWQTDPAFARAMLEAQRAGVRILAVRCSVSPDRMEIMDSVPVELEPEEEIAG